MKKAAFLMGGLLIAGACILSVLYGFTLGNFLTGMIGILVISLSVWFHRFPKIVRTMTGILISLILCCFFIIMSMVIIRGARDTVTYQEDCVLVLGSGIRGETVLPTLQGRLDKCLEYHTRNPEAPILVSGGQGSNENISEAEAMRRCLVAKGIPDNLIMTENQSRNTVENFLYSQSLLENRFPDKAYTIACITSDYHIFRAEKTARRYNVHIHTASAGIQWCLRPFAYFREFLSLLKFGLKN
ncbi:MAG: YdcF family protein [Tannerellaceae bacterium]|nr:YdcF family protein [Tannerellaceae bacterium]